MRKASLVTSILSLIAILSAMAVHAPLNSSTLGAERLASAGLTTGALLIGAVGVLLSIFDSKNLRRTERGKPLRALIYTLCGAICGSFVVGVGSVWTIGNPGPSFLLDVLAYLFVATVYAAAVGVVAAAIELVGWWKSVAEPRSC